MTPLSDKQIRLWIAFCNSLERRTSGHIRYVKDTIELCNQHSEKIELVTHLNYHLLKSQND